jgi:hypothetical protein
MTFPLSPCSADHRAVHLPPGPCGQRTAGVPFPTTRRPRTPLSVSSDLPPVPYRGESGGSLAGGRSGDGDVQSHAQSSRRWHAPPSRVMSIGHGYVVKGAQADLFLVERGNGAGRSTRPNASTVASADVRRTKHFSGRGRT